MQQFRFAHPLSWGYPPGLEEALNRHLKEQGISILAGNDDGTLVFIQLPHKYRYSTWSLADNGGEINVEDVKTGEMVSVATTSSRKPMPANVDDYALTLVVRFFSVFNGTPIDYQWRP